MVEDERARQHHTGACHALQLVAQLHRTERINACLHEWRVRIEGASRGSPRHLEHHVERDGVRCRLPRDCRQLALRRAIGPAGHVGHVGQEGGRRTTTQYDMPSNWDQGNDWRRPWQDRYMQCREALTQADTRDARRCLCRGCPRAGCATCRHAHLGPSPNRITLSMSLGSAIFSSTKR